MSRLPDPVGDYLPHAPPMVFLDRVTELEDEILTAETTLGKGPVFGAGDGAPAAWAVEIAAQACAVFIGFSRRERGFREGRLVKAAGLFFNARSLPFESVLLVQARLTSATEFGFFVFETTINNLESIQLYRGRLSILAR